MTATLLALLRHKSRRRRAPRPAAGSPTHAIAGTRARAVTMATVRPPSPTLQAAGKLPCATTLSSLDAAVVVLRSLRGARQRARLYTLTDSLSNDGGPGADRRVCGLRRLRPALPASSPMWHVRRDVHLGIRRRLRRRWPRLGFRPARADSMWDRTIVSCNKSDTCVYMTESTKNCSA